MFKKRNLAAALVTAAAGLAVMAGPAAAVPIDNVTLDTPNHRFSFGTACANGQAPGGPGTIDWRYNAAGTTTAPRLDGDLCLQSTTARVRMAVTYHDAAHATISRFTSNPATGNGSPLNVFAVATGGARVSTAILDHLLVDIERWDGANWVVESRQVLP